ncbi:major facilitator superfamily domain-containing protein [Cokeromyces recurvatus]|uniref:major facilitator superfamily domain-containing protein n=1 Tax=Cokeromyces recurvatus TaxID=90255 RepID=UPI0022203B36|nr:major facilitator superfamily domain-containing protein [Cokeromyces recurvatus]KAI7900488.1 major facilitator superfamily domain-containing protein [Cokeromyces recurvatus]
MFLAMGSHFAAHTLGAMKSTIKKEFGISNSQYGLIQSSVSIVNTILPLIGGIFIDAFGTIPGSILTTILITFGNILVAISTSTTNLYMMILGRILYGIGSGTVVIVQETILSQWFQGRSLAAVIAFMLTISRLSSFLAQATVVPIAKWTGWYGYGFWLSAMLCVFSLFVNLIYIILLKNVTTKNQQKHCQVQHTIVKRKRSFSWSKLMYLPHSYWLIASMEFLLGGAWGCFLHINSELVKFRFGYEDDKAAAVASVSQVLPIFIMPFLGFFVDKYGKRTWLMIGSGLTFLMSILLLEYTNLHPILGMISFSISLALGPVSLVSSIPIILPLSLVGTGMGLVKSGTNIGASLFDIMTGLLQDHDSNKGYKGVMIFFIFIAGLSILSGIILFILDKKMYENVLDACKKPSHINNGGKRFLMNRKLKINYLYAGIYIALVMTSWILFFRFIFV